MKRLSLLLVIVLTLVLAGCGSSGGGGANEGLNNGSNNGTNNGANNGTNNGSNDEIIELTYWMHQNDAFVNANNKIIADFEEANPNIKIKTEVFPYDDFVQKIRTAYIGDTAPDIAQVFGSWVTPIAKANLLAEIPNGNELIDKYYPATVGAYMVDEKLYGIPLDYNLANGGILVNLDMLDEANVDIPGSWDELVDAAKKLAKIDENGEFAVRGFDFISPDSISYMFLSLVLQQDGTYWKEGDLVDFTTPEAINAVEAMKAFITEHKVVDTKTLGGGLANFDIFFTGQSAMEFDGPWVIAVGESIYGDQAPNFDYVSMPSFTDNPPYFAAESGWGEIVSARSQHVDAALKFVQFATSDENSVYWNSQTGTLPASEQYLTDEFKAENAILQASFDALQYGKFIGPMENTDYFRSVFTDAFVSIVEGADIEQTLKKVEDDVNQEILRNR